MSGLPEWSRGSDNNFDLLRLVAASMVLVSHSFPLTGVVDPVIGFLGSDSLGSVGVQIFFAISGFLVVGSWARDPRLKTFAAKRALRIMPGLMVSAVVTAFLIGPLFTTLDLGAYLTHPETWGFIARNWTLFTINEQLPGVFADNPFHLAVNGSLWTLPLEACAYALVATLGLLGLIRRRWAVVALLVVLTVVTSPYSGIDLQLSALPGGVDGNKVELGAHLIAVFVAGAALFLFRQRIPLHPALFVVAIAAILVSRRSDLFVTVTTFAIPYAVLFLALWKPSPLRALTQRRDLSYGIYVYAFPVQQAVAATFDGISAGMMIAVALPVTALIAALSWRFVEAPALRLKPRPRAVGTPVEAGGPERNADEVAVVR